MAIGVVIAAAGSGRRMGAEENKVFLSLKGRPVLVHSLEVFADLDDVTEIVVVTRNVDIPLVEELIKDFVNKRIKVVPGGAERQESVYYGIQALSSDINWVIIHDGARPYITKEKVQWALSIAKAKGSVGVAVPVKDTIKQVRDGLIVKTPPRDQLWSMQTPQIFPQDLIMKAHEQARQKGYLATDDCALVESLGHPVHIVEGDYGNIKITTPEDLPKEVVQLIGFGYDVHRLVKGRPLILGGIEIPFEMGLLGHSDADVVTHAIMDALLGAAGLGDIGEHFPDTDPQYKGVSSVKLLKEVLSLLEVEKLQINNVDITVAAQKPKLAPWKTKIRSNLAQILGMEKRRINLKATTAEGLGFVGREEGIAVQVVASLCQLGS